MRTLRYVVADVFTDTALPGNQLAVFTDARDLDPLTMQALAKEMAFSETVFVLPPQAEDADVRIRIFTPANELPFAGHPTLGTAFVLGGPLQKIDAAARDRRRGRAGRARARGRRDRVRLDGAADPDVGALRARGRAARRARRRALGAAGRAVPPRPEPRLRRARLAPSRSPRSCRTSTALVRSPTPASTASPATAPAGRRACSRPRDGVAEDPATGSAAGPLAIHLARHGRIAFGEEIEISQGAEIGRPSKLYARGRGRGRPDRPRAGRRLRRDRRARRVQDSLSATASISGSSNVSAVQNTPPFRET